MGEIGPHGVKSHHFNGQIKDRINGLVQGSGKPCAKKLAIVGNDFYGLVDGVAGVGQG